MRPSRTAARTVAWHPDPDSSSSPYIVAQARELRRAGWIVEPLRLSHFRDRDVVVHIHWPEHLVRSNGRFASIAKPAFVAAILAILRLRRRAAVVWTVHNLRPHRPAKNAVEAVLESQLFATLAKQADVVLTLVAGNTEAIRDTFAIPGSTPIVHVPEGIEASTPRSRPSQTPMRFLALGSLLAYKGLIGLAKTAASAGAETVVVHIVGEPLDDAIAQELLSTDYLGAVEVTARRMSDAEVVELLDRIDAVVVTHAGQFNSGAPFWALSRGVPVVTVASNLSRELKESVGPSWIYELPTDYDASDLSEAALWCAEDRDPLDPTGYGWVAVTERLGAAYADANTSRNGRAS